MCIYMLAAQCTMKNTVRFLFVYPNSNLVIRRNVFSLKEIGTRS